MWSHFLRKSTFPENALAPRPALPHAKLEDRQVGGFQEPACGCHDFRRAYAVAIGDGQEVSSGLKSYPVTPAHRRHQGLKGLRAERVETAVNQVPLDPGGELR